MKKGQSGPENQTSIQISIQPPFWDTWPAYIIYTLIIGGILYAYRYYTQKQNLLKTNLERSRMERKKELELAEMKTRFFYQYSP